jgi:hypothetical protein
LTVSRIEVGAVSAWDWVSTAAIVSALPGGLISRRYHSVGKTATVNVEVVSVTALLDLDKRRCRTLHVRERAKLEADYSSSNAHKHDGDPFG